jgi:hypothetical protein
VDFLGAVLDSLYLLSEAKGYEFKNLRKFEIQQDEFFPRFISNLAEMELSCSEKLSQTIEGDYFLNTRNGHL